MIYDDQDTDSSTLNTSHFDYVFMCSMDYVVSLIWDWSDWWIVSLELFSEPPDAPTSSLGMPNQIEFLLLSINIFSGSMSSNPLNQKVSLLPQSIHYVHLFAL